MRTYWNRFYLLAACLSVASPSAWSQALISDAPWLSPEQERQSFHLPPGFEIQLVASEPDIQKPMNLAFDRRGRLLVTHSVEYPYPADNNARDGITILEDIGPDGRARKLTRWAEGLNIPIGITPLKGDTLAVFSIPKIYRLADSDGDGKADRKDPLYGDIGRLDSHGMTSGFRRWIDGWIYACHGFKNDSTLDPARGNAPGITMNSGNTYRFLEDGSRIEQWTWGQVNPFGLTFDALGNLFSADCHTKPVYQLLRGAYYPSFSKEHDGLGFGPAMINHNHGSTGIAGIAYYADDRFPEAYQNNVYIGNVITGRVHRDRLDRQGSTYIADTQEDFIKSDDPWFRPVDIRLGPDGALYIADFYNRIIGHYEVPLDHPGRDRTSGRIWRVVYTGKDAAPAKIKRANPDLSVATVSQLINALGDPNLTLRVAATNELVDCAAPQTANLLRRVLDQPRASGIQKAHALWALHRLEGVPEDALEQLAVNSDLAVRVHVARLLGELPDWSDAQAALARRMLADSDAFVRRAAIDALGRHPSTDNLQLLLALGQMIDKADTHLVHTLRMALRDHLKTLGYDTVVNAIPMSAPNRGQLADVSRGLPTARSAAFVLQALQDDLIEADALLDALQHVVKRGAEEVVAKALDVALSYQNRPLDRQLSMLTALSKALDSAVIGDTLELTRRSREWASQAATQALASDNEALVRTGIDLARQLKLPAATDALQTLASKGSPWPKLRGTALQAFATLEPEGMLARLDALIGDPSEPIALRQGAVDLLSTRYQPETTPILLKHLRNSPQALAVTLAAALANSDDRSRVLLQEIEEGRLSAALLAERTVEARLRRRKEQALLDQFERLRATVSDGSERLSALIAERKREFRSARPDIGRGKAVFQRACAACHQIGDTGGRIGPGLDGIGVRGIDRLLEDIVDPNRNVDQAFWLTTIQTIDRRILAGLAGKEEGGDLVLLDMQGQEIRIPLADINERTETKLSLMPPNLAEQLGQGEFSDLLGYLLSLQG